MTDARQLRTPADSVMAMEGQQNAGGMRRVVQGTGFAYYDAAPLSDYPRMMYRKTDREQLQEHADAVGLKDAAMVINRFDGLLCETVIAESLTDAETLSADGWETSPQAAYGLATGIASATSAKDEEIAALRAQLAAATEKRGPGRPPKPQE